VDRRLSRDSARRDVVERSLYVTDAAARLDLRHTECWKRGRIEASAYSDHVPLADIAFSDLPASEPAS
jgi:hypothetical protein